MPKITSTHLHNLFVYIEDGRLIRRNTCLPAGKITNTGVTIEIGNRSYPLKQLVWLYHYNRLVPAQQIFQIDLDAMNTRVSNLSLLPLAAPKLPPKKAPCEGVRQIASRPTPLYQVRIGFGGVYKYLPNLFECRAEAAAYRLACEQALGGVWDNPQSPAARYMRAYVKLNSNPKPKRPRGPQKLASPTRSPEAFSAAYQKLHAPVPTSILEQLK